MHTPDSMALSFWRQVLLALFLSCGLIPVWASEPSVIFVASESSASYREIVQVLEDELARTGLRRAEMQTVFLTDMALPPLQASPKLYVAVGLKAFSLMAARDSKTPVIATLVPRSAFEQMAGLGERKAAPPISGVCLDQPFARQLDLIRLALPQSRRIGVLWGTDVPAQMARLQNATQGRSVQLVSAQVEAGESVFPALARILEDADVLLAVANPQIYNSRSIQNILLASYRSKVPLVGFSPGYVQAGAVFSLYSTPSMIGRQTAVMARGFLQGKPLPVVPQYPTEFEVGVNTRVARSLGLTLDAANLTERLRHLEPAQ